MKDSDPLPPEVIHAVERWISLDPDPVTRQKLIDLLSGSAPELIEMFDDRIGFGTAGLRAPMGPGPKQMNRLVVRQTTAGLMNWLESNPLVVIGFDARANSELFARDVAGVVAAMGGRAAITQAPIPTPVLANAVLDLGASAGVMITASHNPAQDNGYKLYLRDGIQLVAPADTEISVAIDAVAATSAAPLWVDLNHPAIETLGVEISDAHINAAVSGLFSSAPANRDVRSVYTAMHGVGGAHFLRAVEGAGFERPLVVKEQFEPDPTFPTVEFPNPEEPGALDLAFALAVGDPRVDIVLAHDPDADRLAVGVRGRDQGNFVALSGDELGTLFGEYILRNTSGARIVASSIVSSRLLSEMAKAAGVECRTTLTGFKWVARPMVDRIDVEYVFGYEEAIGYAVTRHVRDKDGISAGLMALEMAAEAKANEETFWDRLDRIASKHGLYAQRPMVLRLDGNSILSGPELVDRILENPPQIVGVTVTAVHDMAHGYSGLAPTTGALVMYSDETRVIIRPSGTEAKVKVYIEVIEPSGDHSVADGRLDQFAAGWKRSLDEASSQA